MKFSEHPAGSRIKAMIVGDSGAGQTTALASLANAGYKLRILDFDSGLDILRHYVNDPDSMDYHTFDVHDPMAPDKAAAMAMNWEGLGPIAETGPNDVLVLDTATTFGQCLETLEAKKNKDGRKSSWEAQKKANHLLQFLTGPSVPCNVIVNTHYRLVENEITGQMKAYPEVVGRKLALTVGRLFNNIWRLVTKRVDKEEVRVLLTQSDSYMTLKCSAPTVIEAEEPLDLADIFNRMKEGNSTS